MKTSTKFAASLLLSLVIGLAGCSRPGTASGAENTLPAEPSSQTASSTPAESPQADPADLPDHVILPFSALSIPAKPIIGMGEATHGNKEFNELRPDVFRYLAETHGARIFALEADFGNCQAVNAYLQNGEGDPAVLAQEIGMWVYRNEEMAAFLEWIRAYNLSAPEGEKIQFYGFDMQGIDNNKNGLLAYMAQMEPDQAAFYEVAFQNLDQETRYTRPKEDLLAVAAAAEEAAQHLEEKREQYIGATSEKEYDLALEYANCVRQSALYYGEEDPIARLNLRDRFMAERIGWILEHEAKHNGHTSVFAAAHNGHIEKTSAGLYKSMGNHLAETYRDDYYAIGTEFLTSTFLAVDEESGEFTEFTLERQGPLAELLGSSEHAVSFVAFAPELADQAAWAAFYTSQMMSNLGAEYAQAYLPYEMTFALPMIPAEAYDALVYLKAATPSTLMEKSA